MSNKISSNRLCSSNHKKSSDELVKIFWEAPLSAFFGEEVVAPVVVRTRKTLQCDRWRGRGIPYRKTQGKILYKKADVVDWLESHALVTSTSQY